MMGDSKVGGNNSGGGDDGGGGGGMCQLCFAEDRAWFQGRVLPGTEASRQLGLFGEQLTEEEEGRELAATKDATFHHCCFSPEDPPTFFRVTVIDFGANTRQVVPIVACTNGDFVKLECAQLQFSTDSIKIDEEARAFAEDFFPKMAASGADVHVCIGSISFSNLPPPQTAPVRACAHAPDADSCARDGAKEGREVEWTDDDDADDDGGGDDNGGGGVDDGDVNDADNALMMHEDEDEDEDEEEEDEEEDEEEEDTSAVAASVPRHPDAWPPVLNQQPHRYDALVEKTRTEVMKEMDSTTDGWGLVKTSSDVEIWKKKIQDSPLVMVRGVGVIERHPAVLFKILTQVDQKPLWNKDFACLDEVEVFDDCTKVIRDEYKPIWPVSGRDMCFVQSLRLLDNGGFFMVSKSVEHPDCPPKSGVVRAEGLGGMRVVPFPNDPNKCTVTYLTAVDPKGNVPTMVVNVVATNQPLCVAAIRKLAMSRPQYTPPPEPTPPPTPQQKKRAPRKQGSKQALKKTKARKQQTTGKQQQQQQQQKQKAQKRGAVKEASNHAAAAAARTRSGNEQASAVPAATTHQQQQAEQPEDEELDASKMILLDPCMYNTRQLRQAVIPSANGHFSARALAKFYAVLANNGRLGSFQLLQPETVATMSKTQPIETPFMQGMRVRWGLGYQKYRMKRDGRVLDTPFGHVGLGGSAAFCDPHTNTSFAITVNRLQLDKEVAERVLDAITDALQIGQVDLM